MLCCAIPYHEAWLPSVWNIFLIALISSTLVYVIMSEIYINVFKVLAQSLTEVLYWNPSDCSVCAEACCCCSVHWSLGLPCAGRVQPMFGLVWLQKTPVPPVGHPAPQLPAQWPRPVEHRGRLRVHLLSARWAPPQLLLYYTFIVFKGPENPFSVSYSKQKHIFLIILQTSQTHLTAAWAGQYC